MRPRALRTGAVFAAVCFTAFFLSGAPIFVRGFSAALCFVVCGLAFNLGAIIGGRPLGDDDQKATVDFLTKLAQADVKLSLTNDRISVLEKRMADLSIAAGFTRPKQG